MLATAVVDPTGKLLLRATNIFPTIKRRPLRAWFDRDDLVAVGERLGTKFGEIRKHRGERQSATVKMSLNSSLGKHSLPNFCSISTASSGETLPRLRETFKCASCRPSDRLSSVSVPASLCQAAATLR